MPADEAPEPMPEGEEPEPRGARAMAIVRWAILAASALVALGVWITFARERSDPAPARAAAAPKFRCPMHPHVVSHDPGECPICHMDLEPIAAAPFDAPRATTKPLVVVDDGGPPAFFCPMDAEVRSATPGRCPLCKMALEPIPDGGLPAPPAAETPPGTASITLALDRIQSIGVRTALAEERTASGALRATAIVEAPEQGAAEVHVRSPGFVEAIRVAETGVRVGAGQPLLMLYSPEILQAQHELVATRAWAGDASAVPGAAQRKLELLGMAPADVERVLATRETMRAIPVVAPRGGFVTKKNVVLGSYVTPETTLYEIQDLSRVYVVADVFLRDLPRVAVGAEARFTPSGRPDAAAAGKIDLVYPVVNAEARTRRVRMQLANEAGKRYSPGEYGTLEIASAAHGHVTIPRDALVDTGKSTYVFLALPEGRFVPRSVTVSGGDHDRVVVASGLSPGERVVSGATFLIDSESRLQASVAAATREGAP